MIDETCAPPAQSAPGLTWRDGAIGIAVFFVAGAFLLPGAPFIIDGGIYADMARAMADRGVFFIADNGGVEGAPALTKHLTDAVNGAAYPQYPSGYALIAAPFYLAFGIHGLMLMNALSFGGCLYLIYCLGNRLYDRRIAGWAVAVFALATFAPVYAFAIWPHMLALVGWLCAFLFAVNATAATSKNSLYGFLILAGAAIGFGVNIRIDGFLAFIVLYVWLRCFARPDDRLAPLALAVGAAPGLLLAAWFNDIKFGAFAPFSYNSTGGGGTDITRYKFILVVSAVIMAALWALNTRKIFLNTRRAHGVVPLAAGVAVACAFALLVEPLRELLWRIILGAYVLVINLQAHSAYYQEGVERNEFGHLLFWGYPKKALLQSLPYLPLIALPAFHFFRGKNTKAIALCLLAISAPIAFYSINEWHGGGSYNMRYFTPALPFIAILSAAAISELIEKAGSPPDRQTLLIIICVSAGAYLGMQEIANSSERFLTPASLYPQWLIAGCLAIVVIGYFTNAVQPRLVLYTGLAALGYAAAVNIYEEFGHEKTRAEQLALARDASANIRPESLVLAQSPLLFMPAEQNGAFVMVGTARTAQETAQAASAFLRAGRCVYIHNPAQLEVIAPLIGNAVNTEPIWAPSNRFGEDPRLAFFYSKTSEKLAGSDETRLQPTRTG